MSDESATQIAERIAFKLLSAARALNSGMPEKRPKICMERISEAARILRDELLPKLKTRDDKWRELHARIAELEAAAQDYQTDLFQKTQELEIALNTNVELQAMVDAFSNER